MAKSKLRHTKIKDSLNCIRLKNKEAKLCVRRKYRLIKELPQDIFLYNLHTSEKE